LARLLVRHFTATNPFYPAVGPLIGLTMHFWASGPGHFTTQALFHIYRCTSTKGSAKISFLLHHQNTAQLGMPPALQGACRPFFSMHYHLLQHSRVPRGLGHSTACAAQPPHQHCRALFPISFFTSHDQQVFNFIFISLFITISF